MPPVILGKLPTAMKTKQGPMDASDIQKAIYSVALSLDAILINGIQMGVFQQNIFPGFLQKTAGALERNLAILEEKVFQGTSPRQPKIKEIMAALQANCRQFIELVTDLSTFRTRTIEEVRSIISQIPPLREACVQCIQELEGFLGTTKPFYTSRPAHLSEMINDFLVNLERFTIEELTAPGEISSVTEQGSNHVEVDSAFVKGD